VELLHCVEKATIYKPTFYLQKGNVTSMVPAMPSEPQLCVVQPTVIIKVVL